MTEKLPDGWAWAKIGDVCHINPRWFDEPPEDDEHLSFVPMAEVEAGTGKMQCRGSKSYADLKKKTLTPFQEDDVIFAKITPCMENGKIALARGLMGGRAFGSTEFIVLRCSRALLPQYLMHFLLQVTFRKEAERNMSGAAGQRRVPKSFISGYSIPLPPVVEQRRIVDALEDSIPRLDSSNHSLSVANRKSMRLQNAAFMSEIRGARYREAPLSDVLSGKIINGRSVRGRDGGFPVLRLNAIQDGGVDTDISKDGDWSEEAARPFLIRPGDYLLIRGNGTLGLVGRGAIVPDGSRNVAFPDTMMRVRIDSHQVDLSYFDLAWNSRFVRSQIEALARTTAGIYKVNQSQLSSVKIPLLSICGQRAIVDRVRDYSNMASRLEGVFRNVKTQSDRLRQSMLTDAFSGRLVQQDPSEEPVSALLERIRADRPSGTKVKHGQVAQNSLCNSYDPQPVPAGKQTALEF